MSLTRRLALQFALTASLATAIALGSSLAVFALRVDGMTGDLSDRFAAALERRIEADAESRLDGVAADARALLVDFDRMGLARVAMEARLLGGARTVRLYDGFGRLLADGDGDPAAFERPAPPILRGLDDPQTVRFWREDENLFAGRAVCVAQECLGLAAVAVDASELDRARAESAAALGAAERRFWIESSALGAAAVLIGSLVAALIGHRVARRLARSVRSAVNALERVAAGEKGVTIEARDAQLAELADAVDKVAAAMEAGAGEAGDALIADMADGLLVVDLTGSIIRANPAVHALLGVAEDSLPGRDAFELFGIGRAQGADAIAAALAAVERYRRPDGSTLSLMISAKATGAAAALRVVAVARDIASRMPDAEALERMTLRAEAAEKAKAEFLSVMSHELRTPLNGILGGAAVLAGTPLDDSQRGFLKIVQNSGKSMLSMVTDILDFSRPEAPEAAIERAPTNLEDVAHRIAATVAERAAEKKLDLYVRVDPEAPVVMTDGETLVEIGGQLADNAVKFTEAGAVGIAIEQRIRADGQAEVTLIVDDDGPGIPLDRREALFDAFSQADGSERRQHGGAGLGLSIAKKLAEKLGGAIAVDAAEGGGSSFRVTFPAPVDRDAKPSARRDLTGVRALVVEPNPLARAALRDQLAHAGAQVEVAETPAAAAQAMRAAQEKLRPMDLVVHPLDALDAPGSADFKEWVVGDGWSDGVAAVALRPEHAAMTAKGLPQRVQHATRPPKTAALIDAAGAALKAARKTRGDDEGRDKAKAKPAGVEDGPEVTVVEGDKATPVVLLADPNEVNRIVLAAWLEKAGYTCVSAENGQQALDLFREKAPKLVLMDIGMPVMTGVEAAKMMRRHERDAGLPKAPIVGLVGKIRDGERERCASAGMSDFLSKPVKTAELEAKLERWTVLFGDKKQAATAS